VARRSGAAPTRPPADERTVALTWPLAPEPPSSLPDDESNAAFERLQADRALHADLFLHGVNRERYRWKPEGRGKAGHLLLFDHKERWRGDLGRFSSPAAAGRTAERLRRRLLELNDASDGLHVVEHVLLRPRGLSHEPIDTAFHALRVTVVFPSWTTRTIRTAFQDFAAETVEINAPAHVLAECLWLDFARMRTFETRYAVWAAALVRYEAAVGDASKVEAALGPLNDAAAKLTAFLKAELDRQREERLAWAEQGR